MAAIPPSGFVSGLENSLAGTMAELGYGVSADEAAFKALLLKFPEPPSEQTVADVLLLMARTHSSLKDSQPGLQAQIWLALGLGHPSADAANLTTWNWPVVVDCLRSAVPRMSWPKVAVCLDSERCVLPDQPAFALLSAAYRRGAAEQIPLDVLIGGMWKHPACQLALLQLAATAPPDVYTFQQSKRLAAPLEGMSIAQLSPNSAWASVDLLQAVCGLCESAALVQQARDVLQYPATACPDLLLITIAETRTTWNLLMRDVFAALLPTHLRGAGAAGGTPKALPPYSRELLPRVWAAAPPEVMLDLLIEFCAQDPSQLPRMAKLCSELGILPQVLASVPVPFALEFAAVAGAEGLMMNLDAWLADYSNRDSMAVIPAMLRFMLDKTADGAGAAGGAAAGADAGAVADPRRSGLPLAPDPARAFLKVLQGSAQGLPAELLRELQAVQQQASKAFPALAPHITAVSPPDTFPSDVEEEANSYFQQIYAPDAQSIDDIIARMQAYKSSPNPREQEVFACMIHNLFDEYRFFSRYPDRELHITAKLFGSLIKHGLVSSITLGMALRYVLDALRKPVASRMFTFGLEALRQFAHMVAPWPQFCSALVSNPQLREADAELYNVVAEQAAQGAAASAGGGAVVAAGAAPGPGSTGGDMSPAGNGHGSNSVEVSSSSQGNSRFLTLQPAAGDKTLDAAVPAPAVPSEPVGRNAVGPPGPAVPAVPPPAAPLAAADKGSSLGAPLAVPPGPVAAVVAAAANTVGDSNGLSMGENDDQGDNMSMQLAASVAAASLAAPVGPSLAALVNTESLETAADKYRDFREPPEAVQDKVHFIMNNITRDNLDVKGVEVRDRVSPDYIPWFANYMVVKRAAQEANYHSLYVLLLEKFNDRELYRLMVKTTMYYVKVLLYSERILKESNDRALLKNLGVWLGKLTLGRHKPVLSRDLEIKTIITEAYQRGRLIAVLPFVQKLLECCKDSKVFTPSNPMMAGILSLLAELHAMKGLKINNAFSIELVFKAFGLNPGEVKPTDTLRALPRERLQNPDWGMEALPQEGPAVPLGQQGLNPADSAAGKGLAATPATPASPAPGAGAQLARGAQAGALGSGQELPGGKPLGPPGSGEHGALPYGMPSPPTPSSTPPGTASPSMATPPIPDAGLFASLHQHVVINPSLGPIGERLQLKRNVPVAVDRAIGEIITPVVERSVTIACYTTYELVMKDFAQEPDESRLRKAAHLMVSSLAGSLSLVTCKDPLRISLTNQLRQMLQTQVTDVAMLEQIVSVVVNDNLDLGCTLIERAATDKAVRDIDKSLQAAYDERSKARAAGKPFVDPSFHSGSRFPAALPDSLRPRPGSIQPHHLRVYDDFARIPRTAQPVPPPAGTVPGAPMVPGAAGPGGVPRPAGFHGSQADGTTADGKPLGPGGMEAALLERYQIWQSAVSNAVATKEANPSADQGDLQALLAELNDLVAKSSSPEDAAAFFARSILKHLLLDAPPAAAPHGKLSLVFHTACLEHLTTAAGQGRLMTDLTLAFINTEDERKLNGPVIDVLLRLRLLSLVDVDNHLGKLLNNPATRSNPAVIDFVMHLVRVSILQLGVTSFSDLATTLELFARLYANNGQVIQLLEQARKAAVAPVVNRAAGEIPSCVRDKMSDPPGLREQSLQLFEEWVRLVNTHADDKTIAAFITGQLRVSGVLKLDDTTDRFLRTLTELSVAHCLASAEAAAAAGASTRPDAAAVPLSFLAMDALVSLVAALVVQGGGEALLSRYLSVLVGVIKRDADEAPLKFNARPFLRVWVGLMSELGSVGASPAQQQHGAPDTAPSAGDTAAQLAYLRICGTALFQLQPLSVPGFAFAWLELIAHRSFMPRMLTAPLASGWGLFAVLLVALLRFMEQYLRGADLADSIKQLYKGCLRLLLVLLHDFPEFLCEHHFSLCDAIPPPAIQMRNLVLSAFPRNMRLPDPFTPNLKVDLLPEIQQLPRIVPDPETLLPEAIKVQVDSFLRQRTPANLPAELAKRCAMGPSEGGAKAGFGLLGVSYNVPLINALVLYVGSQAKAMSSPLHPASQDLYVRMASELDAEGRYLLLNAMANQLRYPNAHTYYFSCTLLTLFMEAKSEAIKEQITRTLLERLIVNRPHPWGLLITFIELIKNRRYAFWSHGFTKCAPEIENLFSSVSRSCLGTARPDEDGGAAAGVHPKEGIVRG